ncbi:MAG: acyl-coenzyme A thioesterase PaaI-like protein [Planctomycetota bacterium]|jgi:acyl-coenzyme A thioesterase PaaI-like protein
MTSNVWDSEALRKHINEYPPYTGAQIEVTHLAADASELRVQMHLDKRNENLVGTHFGGSLYAMVDPHLMILLMQSLGPEYVVWDQSATINFLRPGLGTVHATIRITENELESIRAATAAGEKHLPTWTLEVRNEANKVVASVFKTLYVRRRESTAL